ncbi:hypothetical protein DSO57_1033951 [Entomophthora muscae]|uniref:Uncharacterized protein n=1 Tax=Entomophthora muscae TaxID=34485 RepID=A0ACC2TBA1_9FUNG|nr:hypothetical protein DSO57_1033951 [Entomophthora muscae]
MSIQTPHSSATSSIQACLAFGSKILPWLSLNALAAAVIPFQVVANACFSASPLVLLPLTRLAFQVSVQLYLQMERNLTF